MRKIEDLAPMSGHGPNPTGSRKNPKEWQSHAMMVYRPIDIEVD